MAAASWTWSRVARGSVLLAVAAALLLAFVSTVERQPHEPVCARSTEWPHTAPNLLPNSTARVIYATYGEQCCVEAKERACAAAMELGPFTECHAYNASVLDPHFRRRYSHILEQKRGAGYWLWKPYMLKQLLDGMGPTDVLFYSDAGATIVANMQPLVDQLWREPRGVLLFQLCKHKVFEYTKRDALVLANADRPWIRDKNQIHASQLMLRKTEYSSLLLLRWFSLCTDERALTDTPSQFGEELPGYKGHRHDQALLSLVAFAMDYVGYRDISEWGEQQLCEGYPSPPFHMMPHIPKLVNHHRHLTL